MSNHEVERLAETFGIRLRLQFGSTVTGQVHPRSDVDLAVLLEHAPVGLEALGRLVHELQRLFPDHEVDLAVLNHADPLFLKKVTERCRLLFASTSTSNVGSSPKPSRARRTVVDRELVTREMALILDDLRAVTPLAQKSVDEYLANRIDEVLAERYLERMSGRMIDINVHEGLQAAVRDIPEYLRRVHEHLEGAR